MVALRTDHGGISYGSQFARYFSFGAGLFSTLGEGLSSGVAGASNSSILFAQVRRGAAVI